MFVKEITLNLSIFLPAPQSTISNYLYDTLVQPSSISSNSKAHVIHPMMNRLILCFLNISGKKIFNVNSVI